MITINKIKHLVFFAIVFVVVAMPVSSFAQNSGGATQATPATLNSCSSKISDVGDVICKFGELLNSVLPLLLALGVVYFVWGVVMYVIGSDEEAKKRGKDRIIFGIIGLVIIVGLWGLVNIVVNTFGLDRNVTFTNPALVLNKSVPVGSCNFGGGNAKFQDLIGYVTCIISSSVIPLIFTLALASFAWGVVNFVILGAGEEAKREQGRQFMIWGVIALAVMISVWGLVKIVGTTFNIDTTFIPKVRE